MSKVNVLEENTCLWLSNVISCYLTETYQNILGKVNMFPLALKLLTLALLIFFQFCYELLTPW